MSVEVLASHADIYVPHKVKEVHFYGRYYRRGLDWYEGFFPISETDYQAIGEITPHYLFCHKCPARISSTGTISRLILILCDPVERACSAYWFRKRIDNYRGGFSEFIDDYPEQIDWGSYHRWLANYLKHFDRKQMLILIHEKDLADGAHRATVQTIARFLGVNPHSFDDNVIVRRSNVRFIPKSPRAYSLALKGQQATVSLRSTLGFQAGQTGRYQAIVHYATNQHNPDAGRVSKTFKQTISRGSHKIRSFTWCGSFLLAMKESNAKK